MSGLAIATGIASLGLGAYSLFKNSQAQEEANALSREQFEYNKALQQQLFEREDTAYARTVKDMRNAGLSPLTMSGTDSAGSPISNSALSDQASNTLKGAEVQATALQSISQNAQNIASQINTEYLEAQDDKRKDELHQVETALKWQEVAEKTEDVDLKRKIKHSLVMQADASAWKTRADFRKTDAEANLKDRQLLLAKKMGLGEVVPDWLIDKVTELNIQTKGEFKIVPSTMNPTRGNGGTNVEKPDWAQNGLVAGSTSGNNETKFGDDHEYNTTSYYISTGSNEYKTKVNLTPEQYGCLKAYLNATKTLDFVKELAN